MSNIHTTKINGCTMSVRSKTHDTGIAKTVMEYDEYRLKTSSFPKIRKPVVIDIGCHIGSFSRLAKSIRPDAKIYAYEAHPSNNHMAHLNLDSIPGIKRNFCAVIGSYKKDGRSIKVNTTLTENTGGWGRWSPGKIEIKTITLTDILRTLKRVNLLKIDCEGSEYEIFYGTDKKLLNRIDRIVGEFHGPVEQRQKMMHYLGTHFTLVTSMGPSEQHLVNYWLVNRERNVKW